MADAQRQRSPATIVRFPLLVFGMACLVLGIWGGLERIGWNLPGATSVQLIALHGPLMVLGFLGTVIALERAVALQRGWGYLAPAGFLVGTIAILAGAPLVLGQALQLVGALLLVALLLIVMRIQPNAANGSLVGAAALLTIGVTIWMHGAQIPRVVPWWLGFLVLTILGERLELAAMGRLDARGKRAFSALTGALIGALFATMIGELELGARVLGAALLGFSIWLAYYDIARFTIRRRGLARFVASALLPGYAWLGIGGVLFLVWGPTSAGAIYDAQLHTVLLGFVFSMIFGHAPVIFPAVLGIPIPFRNVFYVHLVLLHVGLVMRITGDLASLHELARLGAMTSGIAIALFVVVTVGSGIAANAARRRR